MHLWDWWLKSAHPGIKLFSQNQAAQRQNCGSSQAARLTRILFTCKPTFLKTACLDPKKLTKSTRSNGAKMTTVDTTNYAHKFCLRDEYFFWPFVQLVIILFQNIKLTHFC